MTSESHRELGGIGGAVRCVIPINGIQDMDLQS